MFVLMNDGANSEPQRALSMPFSSISSNSERQQQHETAAEDMAERTQRLRSQRQRQRAATFAAFMCFGLASWIMTNGTGLLALSLCEEVCL